MKGIFRAFGSPRLVISNPWTFLWMLAGRPMTGHFVIVRGSERRRHVPEAALAAFVGTFGPSRTIDLATLCPQQCARAWAVIIDVDLTSEANIQALRRMPRTSGIPLFFIVDRSFRSVAQAFSVGASATFRFPAEDAKLAAALLVVEKQAKLAERPEILSGVAMARQALADMFEAAERDRPIDIQALKDAGESIDLAIAEGGINEWVDNVRHYHRGTYQHCLLVAGVTVAFGRALGFGRRDRDRIAKAALVHDVGKASIPVCILDKPGRLTDGEMAVMRTHAEIGSDFLLRHHPGECELIDIARHHHEMRDGSGYPDGLREGEISDAVRLVTVCDIYSALIERRSYKPPFSREKAVGILVEMDAKLDTDFVAAFIAFVFDTTSTTEKSEKRTIVRRKPS